MSTEVTSDSKNKNIKTIYLIRHAESEENRRIGSLKSAFLGLGRFKLPSKEDVVASMELLNVSAQIDSDVSDVGEAQINQLGKRIAKDDFIRKMGIELVAHSPLKRARQTSHGMLQTVTASNTTSSVEVDSSSLGSKHPSIQRVVELDILTERTPKEWLPTHYSTYAKRIKSFEIWLSQQKEEVIAVVGHSQYFRSMLGLKTKFHNVDVWSLQLDCSGVGIETKDEEKEEIDTIKDDNDDVGGDGCAIVTEIDGKSLDELVLPRGWRQLKHHYRYDPNYSE